MPEGRNEATYPIKHSQRVGREPQRSNHSLPRHADRHSAGVGLTRRTDPGHGLREAPFGLSNPAIRALRLSRVRHSLPLPPWRPTRRQGSSHLRWPHPTSKVFAVKRPLVSCQQGACRDARDELMRSVVAATIRPGTGRRRSPAPSTTPNTRRGLPPASCHRSLALPGNGASPPSQRGRPSTSNSRGGARSLAGGHPAGRGLLTSDQRRLGQQHRSPSQNYVKQGTEKSSNTGMWPGTTRCTMDLQGRWWTATTIDRDHRWYRADE